MVLGSGGLHTNRLDQLLRNFAYVLSLSHRIGLRHVQWVQNKTNEDIYGHYLVLCFLFQSSLRRRDETRWHPQKLHIFNSLPFIVLLYQTNDGPNHCLFFFSFPSMCAYQINGRKKKNLECKREKKDQYAKHLWSSPMKSTVFFIILTFFMLWHLIIKKSGRIIVREEL